MSGSGVAFASHYTDAPNVSLSGARHALPILPQSRSGS